MFARRLTIGFALRAQMDVDHILADTLDKWGEIQLAEYKSKLDKALDVIAEMPNIGHRAHGFMVYQVEQHRIFYEWEGEIIHIVRILHEKMDAARHLRCPSPPNE